MDKTTTVIRGYFTKLGLSNEIADLYMALISFGPQTISELSRNSKVERTRIYRLIDELLASNLIDVDQSSSRGLVSAAPIQNIRLLINQKEQELTALRDELETVEELISKTSISDPTTKVQFFKGPEGIRQLLTRQSASHTDIFSLAHEPIVKIVGESFWLDWLKSLRRSNVAIKLLHDQHFEASLKKLKIARPGKDALTNYEQKIIAPNAFSLTINIDIWDGNVSYISIHNGEFYGMEINNGAIANIQRQQFNGFWNL